MHLSDDDWDNLVANENLCNHAGELDRTGFLLLVKEQVLFVFALADDSEHPQMKRNFANHCLAI